MMINRENKPQSKETKSINEKRNSFIGKIVLFLAIAAVMIAVAFYYSIDKNLHVYFLDVGQGDSIYVRTMYNYDILIDGGPDRKVLSELGDVMPFWDHEINLVILTHSHSDHLTGILDVLKRYKIDEIISTDARDDSNEYSKFLELIEEKNIPFKTITSKVTRKIDSKTELEFLWPTKSYKDETVDNLNNTSVVTKIIFDNFSILMPGDIEKETQLKLISDNEIKNQISDINILKLPHHGSANLLEDFVNIANPNIGIISVGEKNKFGHPAKAALDILQKDEIKVMRTDLNSTIEVISNGQVFWTVTSK